MAAIRQSHYASHPLVGTLGVPLVVYPGLKLNFLRPKFMREIDDFVRLAVCLKSCHTRGLTGSHLGRIRTLSTSSTR
jgi:hypothetical protein